MYFLEHREASGQESRIMAYNGQGKASRAALDIMGISAGYGVDPVRMLMNQPEYGNRFFIFNLVNAFDQVFDLISSNQLDQAKQLNRKLRTAINGYYGKQQR